MPFISSLRLSLRSLWLCGKFCLGIMVLDVAEWAFCPITESVSASDAR